MADGEDEHEYYMMSDLMLANIQPRNTIEWLFVLDLIDVCYEILSLRRIKVSLKAVSHGEAVESLLRRAALAEALSGGEKIARIQAKLDAKKWRDNVDNAREAIEQRLARQGYDSDAIASEAFMQSRVSLEVLEKRLATAQQRRNSLLREVQVHREFARRARLASDHVIEGSASNVGELPPK